MLEQRKKEGVKLIRVLIVGVGGIGSYLCRELYRLILKDQIDIDKVDITVADNDTVEEKNIKYQNFTKEEIFSKKSKVIADRYSFNELTERITKEEQLKPYEVIILAVDNSATRKLVYDYCYANDIYFIDLRSEGRGVAFFTREADKKDVAKMLGKISEENNSCQLKSDLENGIIQNGNLIIGTIGSQLLLNYLRKELPNPKEFIFRF